LVVSFFGYGVFYWVSLLVICRGVSDSEIRVVIWLLVCRLRGFSGFILLMVLMSILFDFVMGFCILLRLVMMLRIFWCMVVSSTLLLVWVCVLRSWW